VGPGATETVFALGAGDRIVGRDQISNYPAAALKIPIIGDYTGPFPEKVVAAHPDLLIIQGETWDRSRVETWQSQIGVPVAALTAHSVAQEAGDITKIDSWLGTGKAAGIVRALEQPVAKTGGATAVVEIQRSPFWTAGRGTLVDDVMTHAGVRNVANDIVGYKAFNLESLVSRNPDLYILTVEDPVRDGDHALRELRAQPVLCDLPCIRQGRVIVLSGDLLLRPGPRLAEGVRQLAAKALWFHTGKRQ
jgi:iron complex transport system substrate-binding protein